MKTQEIKRREEKLIASNRKARHDYTIISSLEAGIMLTGTEVKSLRDSKCSMQECYAGFKEHDDEELYVFNLHIDEYSHGNRENHKPKRTRKLLINKREAIKMKNATVERGYTLIPLRLYFSAHLVKIEIGVAKAKKNYDKRETIKNRDVERDIRRKYRV